MLGRRKMLQGGALALAAPLAAGAVPPASSAADQLPTGPFLRLDAGPLQARLYEASGHIALAGPDLAGSPGATVITLAPVVARVAGEPLPLGPVVAVEQSSNGLVVVQALGAGTARVRLSFTREGVLSYEVVDWQGQVPAETLVTGLSPGGEHFYGLGEKFNALDQAGRKVRMLAFDQFGNKGDRSYKPVPWFVSTRGYGFHLDSPAESRFTLPTAAGGRFMVLNPSPLLRFELVYGPRLTDVLSRFCAGVGKPPLPPPWAFAPWISSDIWRSGGEVRYAVTKSRERGIPASVFVFDSPWATAYNDFRFNLAQFGAGGTFEGRHYDGFASLHDMMRFLQRNGLKVVCWLTPFVNTKSDTAEAPGQQPRAATYDEAAAKNFFVRQSPGGPPLLVTWWKGEGSPVDFTNPEACLWLTRQLRALLAESEVTTRSGRVVPAIGGFKTDDGEAGNGASTYIPATAAYADGRTGRDMRNGYCVAYHRTVWSVLGQDGVLLARSGFTGTQAFPACWAGDNEPNFGRRNGLPSVVVAGLSAAMSGYAIWGHDIGGYENSHYSPARADLFMRWTQFGCFSPIMQMHRQVSPAPGNLQQYPWGYAAPEETADANQALENYRFYARLHTRLFPYLYTLAKRASETGLPILRPLVLMHQSDPRTFAVDDAYYFGDALLVAPVLEAKATSRDVYLPEGTWFDFWSGDRREGGRFVRWSDPDAKRLPLYARAGAILPMLANDADTLCDADYVDNPAIASPADGLLIRVYPGGDARFTVHDGTDIRCRGSDAAVEVTIDGRDRPLSLELHATTAPRDVTLGGSALPRLASSAYDAAPSGWNHDPDARLLRVKFAQQGVAARLIAVFR